MWLLELLIICGPTLSCVLPQIQLRLVPCVRSAEYGFCSEDCRAAAERSYHRHECGNTHTFRRILDNVKREAGSNKMGSTLDFSRLCFRVTLQNQIWLKDIFNPDTRHLARYSIYS